MIEDFFFLISCLCIQNTDCFSEKHRQFLLDIFCSAFQKSTIDFLCRRLVIRNDPVKPVPDLKNENRPDFFIRNYQFIYSILRFSKPCKITVCKQHTPQIFNTVINFIISQIPRILFSTAFPLINCSTSSFVVVSALSIKRFTRQQKLFSIKILIPFFIIVGSLNLYKKILFWSS